MSEEELVQAYVHGQISRRVFIRGLMGAGVTLGAALAYAGTIAPPAEAREREAYEAYGDPY